VALRRLALDSAAAAAGAGRRAVQAAGPHPPASGGLDWLGQSITPLARATVPVTAPSAAYQRWRASAPTHPARTGARWEGTGLVRRRCVLMRPSG
jgi:hypothetical protein